jgi:hypothetical protein
MKRRVGSRTARALVALIPAFAGCAGVAPGPVSLVMPAHGRSLAQFQGDDDQCRAYALNRLGGVSPEAAAALTLASTVIGAIGLFGLAGAAIDGARGARIGGAVGAVTAATGVGLTGATSASATQTRLDNAYVQCMFTKGHRIPANATTLSAEGKAASGSRLKVGVLEPW